MNPIKHERVLHLERISHTRIQQLDCEHTMVLAALSPMEVHGPHLPLGQDLREAYALGEAACVKLAGELPDWTFLLLPPVPIATDCVPHLGSINFPAHLVRKVAYLLLEPFAKRGFKRLAYTSFHGGPRHVVALEAAAERLTKRYDTSAICLFSAVLSKVSEGDLFLDPIKDLPEVRMTKEHFRQDLHAGFVETSIGLHLWPEDIEDGWDALPDLVANAKLEEGTNASHLYGYKDKAGLRERIERTKAAAGSIRRAITHFREKTYFGYPALSSADQGARVFDHLADLCGEVIAEFLEKGTKMEIHSPLWKFRRILLNRVVNKIADDWLNAYNK
jgi:creatinine amidohydrolase